MIANDSPERVLLKDVQIKLKEMNEVYDEPSYIFSIEDDQVFDKHSDWLI